MTASEPYRDTSVSVEKSKEQIRKALRGAGARGMQMEEEWADGGVVEKCLVRFIWPTETGHMVRVRFDAKPLPPEPSTRSGWKVSPDQRERQAWRGLAWYIESLIKAATFGLVQFETIFLPYFEDDTGHTIGDHLVPRIEQGQIALPRGT